MTISRREFMMRAQLDDATLTAWISEEWIIPHSAAAEPEFAEVDVARADLIRDLRHDLDVNDAGIGVIFARIISEFVLIMFRINEHLGAIRQRGQQM